MAPQGGVEFFPRRCGPPGDSGTFVPNSAFLNYPECSKAFCEARIVRGKGRDEAFPLQVGSLPKRGKWSGQDPTEGFIEILQTACRESATLWNLGYLRRRGDGGQVADTRCDPIASGNRLDPSSIQQGSSFTFRHGKGER